MKKILLSICAIGMLALTSCTKYPEEADRIMEDLAVFTQYDTKADFTSYQTFAIAGHVNAIEDGDTTENTSENAIALLDQVASNMVARGYTEVPYNNNPKPDLAISVTVMETTNTTVYYPYYDPYYWGYYGYWYGYGYYPTAYVSSYSVGSIFIDLWDLKKVATEGKVYVRWEAFIRGLFTGGHTEGEIKKSVDQAFTQTPQLTTTPN